MLYIISNSQPSSCEMYYTVTFKLIYSEKIVSVDLPEHIKFTELHEYIRPYIERTYGITEFNILPVGTSQGERAAPITIEDVKVFHRYPKYFTAFYISKVETPQLECDICISDVAPRNMIRMNCGHSCCRTCIGVWRERGFNTCPFCRRTI